MSVTARVPAAVALAAASLLSLSACFGASGPVATPTPTIGGAELIDTTWAGTDSDGDDWAFTFEADGTVAVDFNGDRTDDPRDIWTVDGSEIVISVEGGDQFGDILHTGRYTGLEEPMDLDVRTTVGDQSWTIIIERQE